MTRNLPNTSRRFIIGAVMLLAIIASVFVLSNLYTGHAQGDQTITIKGPVEKIEGDHWTVAGATFVVNVSTTITGSPAVGTNVTVTVIQAANGDMTAVSIIVIIIQNNGGTPTATATATNTPAAGTPSGTPTSTATATTTGTPSASATAVPFVTIIIEGPVEQVNVTASLVLIE